MRPDVTSAMTALSISGFNLNEVQQSLNDLHTRRNRIIAHLQHQGSAPLTPRGMKPPTRQQEQPRKPSSDLVKSVADTYVATRTMFSLATSGLLNEPQSVPSSYVQWSSDDSYDTIDRSDMKTVPQGPWSSDESCNLSTDVEVDDAGDDDVKSLFSWFEEENAVENCCDDLVSKKLTASGSFDQSFIPFDPPLVSRFGPISRMARSKLKNTAPVQVTADETTKRMTPVTAVTAMECPLPVAAPVPSRFSSWEIPPPIPCPREPASLPSERDILSTMWPRRPESQFMIQSDPTRFSRQQLQQEVMRLENRAQDACSEDESLAYELQAIELKISMQQTVKKANPVYGERGCNNFSTTPHQPGSTLTELTYPVGSIRASDPALTADEQKKLHELATTFGSADQKCSEQQERILSQLLKLQDLGNQSSQIHQDHT